MNLFEEIIDFFGIGFIGKQLAYPGEFIKPGETVRIVFEAHATTTDNEMELASGWNDVGLSELGERQAVELGARRTDEHFDAIFCSDLQRSYRTAEIAFGRRFPIIKDKRLRECDYGDMTGKSAETVKTVRVEHITVPFLNGESYEQTSERMREFLVDLLRDYAGKRVLIIGHRATQYGLEHWINRVPLAEAVVAPWQWQPGWEYELKNCFFE